MMEYNTLDNLNVGGKTVFLRVDFNMPLDKKTLQILDTTRMMQVLPTIKELVEKKAKTVIIAHQGRKDDWDFTNMQQHANALQKLVGKSVHFVDDIYGLKAQQAIKAMKPGDILFLDNVRNLDYETEKKTAKEHAETPFIKTLSPLGDVFVNDAFAAAHRAQCSLIGFTAVLPSCVGRLMEKELFTLSKVVKDPEKPCVFLFGGAKYSDIIVTIERILQNNTADRVLLTGLPANAFLKSKGYHLGERNEQALLKEGSPEQFDEIKQLLIDYKDVIDLPTDFAIEEQQKRKEITLDELPTNKQLFDIGSDTIHRYKEILNQAKTIFLSGPCGVFENPLYMKGTKEIFTFVANSDAFSIIGGGHTVAAVTQLGLDEKISHISTGGGALEKFMMGEKLPVIEALKQAKINPLLKH
ncbi:MAG: phosphoglycerate kinase [Thermoplasmatota archaeon]